MNKGAISQFIEKYYLHFNSAALVDAAKDYEKQLESGSKMLVSLAGAMSTAELGKIFAEMIRQDKVQIVSCTGANLEEDVMNLVAHSHYKRVPNYRDLTPKEEWELLEGGLNRVTDTCIPEEEAFRRIQEHIFKIWKEADDKGERYLPHEFLYKLLLSGVLEEYYEIDLKDSWMYAAAIVLTDSETSDRLGALTPLIHIAVLDPKNLVQSIAQAIAQFGDEPNIIWATGPSKTGDVEGILIEGVHGPGVQICFRMDT